MTDDRECFEGFLVYSIKYSEANVPVELPRQDRATKCKNRTHHHKRERENEM